MAEDTMMNASIVHMIPLPHPSHSHRLNPGFTTQNLHHFPKGSESTES